MKKKLKIAIYSGAIPSTTFIETLIKSVSQHHEVLLFGTVTKSVSYNSKNIKVFKIPKTLWIKSIFNSYRFLLLALTNPIAVKKMFREVNTYNSKFERWQWFSKILPILVYKPDIFHIQWSKNLENFMFLKTDFNIPIVLSLRGAHINYSPIVSPELAESYRKFFPKVDAFHAVSKAIGSEAVKYKADPKKIKFIYSIVPKIFFNSYRPYKKNNLNKTMQLLSIGRPHWIKGYIYALDSIAILKKQGFSVAYSIVGINEPDEELLYKIESLNLTHDVKLIKSKNQIELIALMHNSDALLLSSLKEGIANVVLEAMAVGLPVISTDCGGMNEVIISNKTGFLVPIRNAEAMAKAILDLSTMQEAQLSEMTVAAHNLIKSQFNEHNLNTFLELYTEVAK